MVKLPNYWSELSFIYHLCLLYKFPYKLRLSLSVLFYTRCPKYDDLPAECRLISDPYNPCCKKAYCPADKVPTPGTTLAPSPGSKSNISSVVN